MYGDAICNFIGIKLDGAWYITEHNLKPRAKHIQKIFGIKEHEASNWFEMDMERAENVVKIRAWFNPTMDAQVYEIGYCEARLSPADYHDIELYLRTYWDIPF